MSQSVPAQHRHRLLLASVLAVALAAGACGGSAATPTPTPVPTMAPEPSPASTPAPTAAPTAEPTDAATPEATAPAESPAGPEITTAPAGTFLFGYEDMLSYYQSAGYQCQEPGPSAVAAGYTTHVCTLEAEAKATNMIGFLVADDGALGDVFAGVLNPAGGEMPDPMEAIEPLAFVLGATLGETEGAAAAEWLVQNIGTEMAQAEFNGNTVYTYTVDDDSGVGTFSEVATPAYLAAPAP
jgi:hypothetical protein